MTTLKTFIQNVEHDTVITDRETLDQFQEAKTEGLSWQYNSASGDVSGDFNYLKDPLVDVSLGSLDEDGDLWFVVFTHTRDESSPRGYRILSVFVTQDEGAAIEQRDSHVEFTNETPDN